MAIWYGNISLSFSILSFSSLFLFSFLSLFLSFSFPLSSFVSSFFCYLRDYRRSLFVTLPRVVCRVHHQVDNNKFAFQTQQHQTTSGHTKRNDSHILSRIIVHRESRPLPASSSSNHRNVVGIEGCSHAVVRTPKTDIPYRSETKGTPPGRIREYVYRCPCLYVIRRESSRARTCVSTTLSSRTLASWTSCYGSSSTGRSLRSLESRARCTPRTWGSQTAKRLLRDRTTD